MTGNQQTDRYEGVRLTATVLTDHHSVPYSHLASRSHAHIINVLIDTGCLHANIISAKIASVLAKDGGQKYRTNIVLTAGVGDQSCGCSKDYQSNGYF